MGMSRQRLQVKLVMRRNNVDRAVEQMVLRKTIKLNHLNASPVPSNATMLRGSIVGAISNAIINGAIQWYLLRDQTLIPLSVDRITNDEHTVFGTASHWLSASR